MWSFFISLLFSHALLSLIAFTLLAICYGAEMSGNLALSLTQFLHGQLCHGDLSFKTSAQDQILMNCIVTALFNKILTEYV